MTVISAAAFGRAYGSLGAAIALVTGGIVNTLFAMAASRRLIGLVPIANGIAPALIATVVSLAIGAAATAIAGALAGAIAGCLVFVLIAARQQNDLVRILRSRFRPRP